MTGLGTGLGGTGTGQRKGDGWLWVPGRSHSKGHSQEGTLLEKEQLPAGTRRAGLELKGSGSE